MSYHPKWSKAQKHLMSFVCDSLHNRIDFQVINYRKAHDQLGRAVLTVDKVEMLTMCTITAEREAFYKEIAIRTQLNDFNVDDAFKNQTYQTNAYEQLKKEGIYAQFDFFSVLEDYFNSPIERSLQSKDMLIKILCMLDRRVGKRTLRNMQESILEEHPLVYDFYKLRCAAEHITIHHADQ